jgi:exodeoxyribonuclease VIII
MENYHKIKDYLSYSALKNYLRSPKYFKYVQENPEETDAMNFGSAFHLFILEPAEFEKQYYCVTDIRPEPEKNLTIKVNKDWNDNHKKNAILQNKTFLNADDYNCIVDMAREMSGNPVINQLLTGGVAEKGILIEDFDGLKVKCKPDYYTDNYIIDLKTTGTNGSTLQGFQKQAAIYNYQMQAAFYKDILFSIDQKEREFYFIVVEKEKPHLTNIFKASENFIAYGRYGYGELLKIHKYCIENGWGKGNEIFYANKNDDFELLDIPSYAMKELKLIY